MNLSPIVTGVWCMVPVFGLAGMLSIRKWLIDRRKERLPTSDKLLRPAGESLRRRIEQLDDKVNETLVLVMTAPFLFAAMILSSHDYTRAVVFVYVVVGVILFAWIATRFLRAVSERRTVMLDFHGERAVAEELNHLMRQGCRVFHDVPMEPYGNIDHVVVASSGVYAVETKTRRKRPAPAGKRDYEVVFNGKGLEFPHCTDAQGIQQATMQADRLRAYLSDAVGEPVAVTPILTLPGWLVTSRVNGKLKVLNPKTIQKVVVRPGEMLLSSQLIKRVAFQLDQKCRDVAL
jgi:hypothetical protein